MTGAAIDDEARDVVDMSDHNHEEEEEEENMEEQAGA
jgi:hypothetical protein